MHVSLESGPRARGVRALASARPSPSFTRRGGALYSYR